MSNYQWEVVSIVILVLNFISQIREDILTCRHPKLSAYNGQGQLRCTVLDFEVRKRLFWLWIKSCIPFLSNASVFTYCEKCLFLSISYVFAKQKSTGRTQKKILFNFQISTCYQIKFPRCFKWYDYAAYCYISCTWISVNGFEMTLLHVFKNYVAKTIPASLRKYQIGDTGMKLYKINKEE